MDRQAIFNQVASHLLQQNAKAFREDTGDCAYLTEEGLQCAVGCLIPDGHPGFQVEGPVTVLLAAFPDLKETWGVEEETDEDFLDVLQGIHDLHQTCNWEDELEGFAERHNLSTAVLKETTNG